KMVGPGRPEIVLFGSSVVQMSFNVGGWGAILSDLYARKADFKLRGYSGWNSRMALEILHKLFPKDAVVKPSLVIVYFGGNDATNPHPSGLGSHVPLHEYVENMRKIILHLKSLSDSTHVICMSTPPVNEAQILKVFGSGFEDQARKNENCRVYAEALVDLCKELGVEGINLYTALQQRREDWAEVSFIDGMHLSAEGSKAVVREILKVIKGADWKPSLYWLEMEPEFPEGSPYYVVAPDGKSTVNVSPHVCSWQKEWVDI
ncbi:hypothetical protein M569_14235, partial [Genlisea aurea]